MMFSGASCRSHSDPVERGGVDFCDLETDTSSVADLQSEASCASPVTGVSRSQSFAELAWEDREVAISEGHAEFELRVAAQFFAPGLERRGWETLAVMQIASVREACLRRIRARSWRATSLAQFPVAARRDREVVLQAVRRTGAALRYADTMLLTNEDVVFAAVLQNAKALRHADITLRSDRSFMLRLIQHCPEALESAAPNILASRRVGLVAVRRRGKTLRHLSETLRRDAAVVLAAVSQNVKALQWADESLRSSRDFMMIVLQRHPKALQYAGPFRGDRDAVLAAVRNNGCALRHATPELRADLALALVALKRQPRVLRYIHPSVLAAVEVQRLVSPALRTSWIDSVLNCQKDSLVAAAA